MKEQIFYRAIVINNKDPENARRVKVRVIGVHPLEGDLDYNLVSDEVLPWALPNIPITDGKNNGKYGKFDVPDEGDIVRVFFEDTSFQKPVYFGIVTTNVDKNDDFKQGENNVFLDRWNNFFSVDADEIKIIKNNNTAIKLTNDYAQIKTKDGNQITLDDKNSSCQIVDKNKNKIETTKDAITLTFNNGEYIKIENGSISLGTSNDTDVSILGNQLMWWLGLHTHVSPTSGGETTPPKQVTEIQNILKQEVQFKPLVLVNTVEASDVEKEEEIKSLVNRGGEENIVFSVKSESDYAKMIEDGEIEIDESLEEQDITQREIIRETEVERSLTFDEKYPIREKPFHTKSQEDDFNSKLLDIDSKLANVLRESIKRYNFVITSGYRSPEKQYELYKQKLTPCDGYKKLSLHNRKPCPCVDISPRPGTISDITAVKELNEVIAEISKRQGIRVRWLGDVVMPNGTRDYPHYELFNGVG